MVLENHETCLILLYPGCKTPLENTDQNLVNALYAAINHFSLLQIPGCVDGMYEYVHYNHPT